FAVVTIFTIIVKSKFQKMKKVTPLLVCFILMNSFIGNKLCAQGSLQGDSLPAKKVKKERNLKNTIRFNLTNPIIFGDKALVFGYERVLGPRQTISVNLGQTSLPGFSLADLNINNENIQLNKSSTDKGYNVSLDYRFYLQKLNKFNAPRGVYIAPYFSHNHFQRENTWTLNTASFDGNVTTDFQLNINTFGAELGYQFVFWKRVALDFVLFGPGVASYGIKTKLDTNLDADDEAALFEYINDFLAEKFPGYSVVIDDQEFKKSGTAKTTSIGFRYMIHLGVRF
ncbi:MAG TPA: hypothetical protein PKD91_16660, partial [Bacteroidia bacterium]|nr:hypothetical protein [Bacteroidia bacterium]